MALPGPRLPRPASQGPVRLLRPQAGPCWPPLLLHVPAAHGASGQKPGGVPALPQRAVGTWTRRGHRRRPERPRGQPWPWGGAGSRPPPRAQPRSTGRPAAGMLAAESAASHPPYGFDGYPGGWGPAVSLLTPGITGVPGPGAGSGSHAKVSGGVGLPPRGAAQGSPRLLRAAAVASGPVPEGSPVSPALGAQPGNHRGAGGGPQAPGQARPSGGAGTLEWRPRARASVLTPGSRLARSLGPSS